MRISVGPTDSREGIHTEDEGNRRMCSLNRLTKWWQKFNFLSIKDEQNVIEFKFFIKNVEAILLLFTICQYLLLISILMFLRLHMKAYLSVSIVLFSFSLATFNRWGTLQDNEKLSFKIIL